MHNTYSAIYVISSIRIPLEGSINNDNHRPAMRCGPFDKVIFGQDIHNRHLVV